MRISTYGRNETDISVKVDQSLISGHHFSVYFSIFDYVALTHEEASLLHTQLTAALYEYEGGE